MLFWVEQAFVGREEIRAPLKTPAWEATKRLDRGETLKHPFPTDAAASSWLNQSRDDRKSKTRSRNKHQIIRQIRVDNRSDMALVPQDISWGHTWTTDSKRSLHESPGEPRGERDVIRLRNPTEDKRAFRRMLTSADPATKADSKVLWVILESREKNQNGVLRIGSELCRV